MHYMDGIGIEIRAGHLSKQLCLKTRVGKKASQMVYLVGGLEHVLYFFKINKPY